MILARAKILPSKIENIILQCEGVAQVGVAGVPAFAILGGDETAPARFLPRAFVILRPGAKTTTEDIVNFVKGQQSLPDVLECPILAVLQLHRMPNAELLISPRPLS